MKKRILLLLMIATLVFSSTPVLASDDVTTESQYAFPR